MKIINPNDKIYKIYKPYESEACKGCPNNPKNGGNGVCWCTLNLPKITC